MTGNDVNEMLLLAGSLAGGFIIGLLYFAILWLSVRRLPTASHPVLLAVGSLLLRLAVALGGFYLIASGDWRRFVIALVGFTIARFWLSRRWGERKSRLSAKPIP